MEIGKTANVPLWRAATPVRRRLADAAPNRGPSMKRWATVLPFCLGLFASACSSTPAAHNGSTTTTTTTSSSTVTSTTADLQANAVLAGYRAEQAAFRQAFTKADPYSPLLAETMVNPQLQSVRRALLSESHDGMAGKGTAQLHPRLLSIGDGHAVVVDCLYSTEELIYASSGKPVPPITPPEHDAVRSTLTEVSPGHWKVARQTVTERLCPAGY